MILSVTLNPSVDHALFLDELKLGDTNRIQRTERDAGGKGVNLSRVVAELGAPTMATGFLGGGPGDYVRGVLDRQGVSHCFVQVQEDTRINFSVEDDSGRPPTTFNERGPNVNEAELSLLFEEVRRRLPKVRWLALGGSLPPGVPVDAFASLIQLGREHGVRIALDADGDPLAHGLAAGPDFVKPNAKEAGRALGREIATAEEACEAAHELQTRLHAAHSHHPIVVVSLGADGAVMACRDGVFRGISPSVEVHSTIGSGDSLIAGMLWSIEQGKPLPEALRWGLACGAATAASGGSDIARRPKILELLDHSRVERWKPG